MQLSEVWEKALSGLLSGAVFAWLVYGRFRISSRPDRIVTWRIDDMGLHTWDIEPGVRTAFVGSGYDQGSA